jgi:hypothetical protein
VLRVHAENPDDDLANIYEKRTLEYLNHKYIIVMIDALHRYRLVKLPKKTKEEILETISNH